MHSAETIERCRNLRRKGFTLGEIVKIVKIPKTTIFDHIQDIQLPLEVQERIKRESIERLIKYSPRRKGKCIAGRIVPKPKKWSNELLFLVAHFMFDGEIKGSGCIYHNRSKALINQVESLMKKVFNLKPYNYFNEETGVYRIAYYYVELADYIRKRAEELRKDIKTYSLARRKLFLKVFYNDEGYVSRYKNKRSVRGFQNDLKILELVQDLLKDFDIYSRIDKKYKEIVISRKKDIIKFRDKINFSKGVYINPERKNSVWKKKLEKRKILDIIIDSYQK